MKFFLLLVATLGVAFGLPTTDMFGRAINGTVSMVSKGINVSDSTVQRAARLFNSTAAGGLDMVLSAISGGIGMTSSSVQAGAGVASNVVKGVGENLKGIWGIGALLQKTADLTASAISTGANLTSSGLATFQNFEKKKFGLIKSAVNVTTSKIAGITSSGFTFTKNGVNAVGSTASNMITSRINSTASCFNKILSFFG